MYQIEREIKKCLLIYQIERDINHLTILISCNGKSQFSRPKIYSSEEVQGRIQGGGKWSIGPPPPQDNALPPEFDKKELEKQPRSGSGSDLISPYMNSLLPIVWGEGKIDHTSQKILDLTTLSM